MTDVRKKIEELKFRQLPKIETPHKNVDVKFFEAMGVTVKVLQFYQIALEYPDLPKGCRFMWYPTTGTLVYEAHTPMKHKRKFFDSEDVWKEIQKRCV